MSEQFQVPGWVEWRIRACEDRLEYLFRYLQDLRTQIVAAAQAARTASSTYNSAGGGGGTGGAFFCQPSGTVSGASGTWPSITAVSFTANVYSGSGGSLTLVASVGHGLELLQPPAWSPQRPAPSSPTGPGPMPFTRRAARNGHLLAMGRWGMQLRLRLLSVLVPATDLTLTASASNGSFDPITVTITYLGSCTWSTGCFLWLNTGRLFTIQCFATYTAYLYYLYTANANNCAGTPTLNSTTDIYSDGSVTGGGLALNSYSCSPLHIVLGKPPGVLSMTITL